jgi:hypothetical protein
MRNLFKNINQDTPSRVSNAIKGLTGSAAFMALIADKPYFAIGLFIAGAVMDTFWPGKPSDSNNNNPKES